MFTTAALQRAFGLGCLIGLALSGLVPARAATWTWTGGPGGGFVNSIVTTPRGTLLAGFENGGLYRSVDAGLTWTQPTLGLDWPCCNYNGSALAVSQVACYLGTWGGGVFRSDDDGDTWFATGTVPGDAYPIVLGLVTCRHGDRVYASGNFGVVRSDDAGLNWAPAAGGLPGGWCRTLALRGTTLYVRTDSGVYRLVDGAPNWEAWNDGLPETGGMQSLTATADALFLSTHVGGIWRLDCADSTWAALNADLWDDHADALTLVDQTLYCGTMGSGVFRFDAATMAWVQTVDGLWQGDVRVMNRHGLSPWAGTFGAGLFALDPDTQTWAERNDGIVAPLLLCVASDGDDVYAGTNGGAVWRSTDAGATWEPARNGLDQSNVFKLAVSGGTVFAGNWNGVWKSTDHGGNWSPAGLQGHGVFALRALGGVLYAGQYEGSVWKSLNNGATWSPVGSGLPGSRIQDVALLGTALFAATGEQGVYRLPDGATTWAAATTGLPELNTECLAVSEGELLVGLGSLGVHRWNPVSGSWASSGLDHQAIFCMTPTGDSAEVLAGTWGYLARSTDGGHTWAEDGDGLKPWLAIRALEAGNGWLYAGLEGGGIWRRPGGVTAVGPEAGPPPALSLAVEPNPFNPSATVHFSLDRAARVEMTVLDVAGRQVATLASEPMPQGTHRLVWPGTDAHGAPVTSGLYFVRMRVGGTELISKVLRVK